jgi:renalase
MKGEPVFRVAVVGAGMAGATCARQLADAGFAVHVVDKSRGVGGRMATRRAEWHDMTGTPQPLSLDHGAPGFSAQGREFAEVAAQLSQEGLVARWTPRWGAGSYAPLEEAVLWVAQPDMPAVCRHWLAGVPLTTHCAIDALHRGPDGWVLSSGAASFEGVFDAVILTMPGPQAARLLRPHEPQWAERAATLPMRPTWTLMGVTDELRSGEAFDLAWPASGELECIVRNDAKPGRQATPGLAQWVAHASKSFSEAHVDASAPEVQSALQGALARWLGRPLAWHDAVVHRWRYAAVPRAPHAAQPTSQLCWWSASLGLGVCGDALGGAGVEGAWASGRALALQVIQQHAHGQGRSAAQV